MTATRMAEAKAAALEPSESLLARRLTHLYKTARPANGKKKYSDQDVATAINAAAGKALVGRTHLYQLRTGRSGNPSYKLILALARFFDVPPGYFFPDEDAARGEVPAEAQAALRVDGVLDMALEFAALPSLMREAIHQVIAAARRIENGQVGSQKRYP